MTEITRSPIARVGVDLSKRTYQVHAVDRGGRVVLARSMSAERFFTWCAELPAGCMVAMETCGGAHHVARRLRGMGLDARLVAGHFVTPYRMAGKSGKNDANDAAAICEAAGRPHMRFVPAKSVDQQGQLAVHRLREGFKEERTVSAVGVIRPPGVGIYRPLWRVPRSVSNGPRRGGYFAVLAGAFGGCLFDAGGTLGSR